VLFVMHERQDMGAVLAQPIMLHAVRGRRRIFLRPESEELPAFQPVKSSWARRICALRMKLLRERNARPYLASGQWLLAFALTPSFSFLLQSIDAGAQPLVDRSFDLLLIALPVERIQGLSRCIQRNMPARELLGAMFRWHQLNQNAIRTGAQVFLFLAGVIYAGGRVLEDKAWPPCNARSARTLIPTLFKKIEFVLQDFQQISFIFAHKPTPVLISSDLGISAVTFVTLRGDIMAIPLAKAAAARQRFRPSNRSGTSQKRVTQVTASFSAMPQAARVS
jgi:hypothetical protein